jgi:hypothetical protein
MSIFRERDLFRTRWLEPTCVILYEPSVRPREEPLQKFVPVVLHPAASSTLKDLSEYVMTRQFVLHRPPAPARLEIRSLTRICCIRAKNDARK